jgi:multidrug efflux pump subunit AcrA (membrane-fusion protein)
MTATVNITTAERIGTLLVPASALSFSTTAIQNGELTTSQLRALVAGASSSGFGSTQGSRGIIVELKNGKLVPVLVRTGLSNGQFTEILSGLNAGDQVVVSQTGGQTTTTSSGTTGASRLGGGGFGGGGGGGRSGGGSSGGSGSGNGG